MEEKTMGPASMTFSTVRLACTILAFQEGNKTMVEPEKEKTIAKLREFVAKASAEENLRRLNMPKATCRSC